ncbi:uncharacterized protein CIMG_13478 [Coccidioides immitis RS]|uniref:Uncharacterized protein n=1 Tax=Coccidioides immitis (strain RS) TaxID=246410 RepID=A0A0D8JY72_COCIM|nr:uncharacterized protein CIMG_13478 [Coccidioides immitis RS]KJF61198.1 hypothetical protein CIMG_13478 [Coccidioides immitis RS]
MINKGQSHGRPLMYTCISLPAKGQWKRRLFHFISFLFLFLLSFYFFLSFSFVFLSFFFFRLCSFFSRKNRMPSCSGSSRKRGLAPFGEIGIFSLTTMETFTFVYQRRTR